MTVSNADISDAGIWLYDQQLSGMLFLETLTPNSIEHETGRFLLAVQTPYGSAIACQRVAGMQLLQYCLLAIGFSLLFWREKK